jgi:erythromycin esterase
MAENVSKILTSSEQKVKFLWAHNFHIKKNKIIYSNDLAMGHHLKQKFGDKYYSVGFDFGTGKFNVFDVTENRLTTISMIE